MKDIQVKSLIKIFKITSAAFKTKNTCLNSYYYYLTIIKYDFKVVVMVNSNEEEPPRPTGIQIGTKALMIETSNINENPINLKNLLKTHDGVLIDFFRGSW